MSEDEKKITEEKSEKKNAKLMLTPEDTNDLNKIREDIKQILTMRSYQPPEKNTLSPPDPPTILKPLIRTIEDKVHEFNPTDYLNEFLAQSIDDQKRFVDDIFTTMFGKPSQTNKPLLKPKK